MRKTGKIVITLVTALLLVFTAACVPAVTEEEEVVTEEELVTEEEEVTPTVDWGIIEIRVTDPPPADVKSANVTLTNIEVHRVSGNASGWIPVIGAPSNFDLLDVIGVQEVLGSANVTAGNFTQIRMDVVEVVGETTDNVSYTAEVPSGKLKIVGPFNVGGGTKTILTLDFDGEKSLIRTGSGKFLFKPVVKLLIEKEHSSPPEQEREREQEREGLEFKGTIEAINGDNWTMSIESENRTVDVSGAEIEGEPAVGFQAEVEGIVVDNIIIASEVEIKETKGKQEKEQEQEGEELEFKGTIEAINGDNWTMSIESENRTVDVSGAEIDGEPAVGLQVEVKGVVVDNIIIASEVEIKEAEE